MAQLFTDKQEDTPMEEFVVQTELVELLCLVLQVGILNLGVNKWTTMVVILMEALQVKEHNYTYVLGGGTGKIWHS